MANSLVMSIYQNLLATQSTVHLEIPSTISLRKASTTDEICSSQDGARFR